MSTKAQTAMSSSFGGDLEQFTLTPSSADVISAPLRTSTHSEVLGKRTTPIAFAFFFATDYSRKWVFCILGQRFCPNFRTCRPFLVGLRYIKGKMASLPVAVRSSKIPSLKLPNNCYGYTIVSFVSVNQDRLNKPA